MPGRATASDLGGIGCRRQGLGGFATQTAQKSCPAGRKLGCERREHRAPPPVECRTTGFDRNLTSSAKWAVGRSRSHIRKSRCSKSELFYVFETPSRPLQLSDSDEQHLRGDPYGYINENAGYLGDFVRRGGGEVIPRTYRAPGALRDSRGEFDSLLGNRISPLPFGGQPQSTGFHPSVSSNT